MWDQTCAKILVSLKETRNYTTDVNLVGFQYKCVSITLQNPIYLLLLIWQALLTLSSEIWEKISRNTVFHHDKYNYGKLTVQITFLVDHFVREYLVCTFAECWMLNQDNKGSKNYIANLYWLMFRHITIHLHSWIRICMLILFKNSVIMKELQLMGKLCVSCYENQCLCCFQNYWY